MDLVLRRSLVNDTKTTFIKDERRYRSPINGDVELLTGIIAKDEALNSLLAENIDGFILIFECQVGGGLEGVSS